MPAKAGCLALPSFEERDVLMEDHPNQLRASHKPWRTEAKELNALPYRSTRYHRTHLRVNMRMTHKRTPDIRSFLQRQALRFHILMGNAGAKNHAHTSY